MESMFSGLTERPLYRPEPDLRVLEHGDRRIVINPDIGGWAVVSARELIELLNPTGTLSKAFGEVAYRHGLARKNGHSVFDASAQDTRLFFFEFVVSDTCNLACTYCCAATEPARKIPPPDLSMGTLWVDRILEYSLANAVSQLELEFTGGEPLASVQFLEHTLAYAQSRFEAHGIGASYSLVTNLTLLGQHQLDLLHRFPIQLNLSIDGTEEDHDTQRPFAAGRGSYRAVMKNLARLRQSGIHPHGVQSTITVRTVAKLPEIARHLLDLGFTQLSLHRMNPGGVERGDPLALVPDPRVYVEKLFEIFETECIPFWRRTGTMPHVRFLGLAFAYLLESKRAYMCQRSPCGAGRTIVATKPNGDVYGCAIGPWTEAFRYGNLHRNTFEDCQRSAAAQSSARRLIRDIPGCRECLFRGWCQGGCAKDAMAVHGTLMAPSPSCPFYRELWRRALFALVDGEFPEEAVRAVARSYLV
ncbi:MAG TPA: radical SAM protein [Thermoanaerobaculia bacterium]|nr:radical SAM protein [Thermoanaerobaculia bacterium]